MQRPMTRRPTFQNQSGMTLVELLIALTISMVLILAAAGVLIFAQQGFRAVDTGGQLRDDGRFATELLTRLIQQAGYEDVRYSGATRSNEFRVAGSPDPLPYVEGWDNAIAQVTDGSAPLTTTVDDSRNTSCVAPADDATACLHKSDVLMIRYQAARNSETSTQTDTQPTDGNILRCDGYPAQMVSGIKADVVHNVIYQKVSKGESSLMCRTYDYFKPTATLPGGTRWNFVEVPILKGVESFQVLYGTDGVVPNTVPSNAAGTMDTVVERYLTAKQMRVAGNPAATAENWRRVRSVRIGIITRGPPGSGLAQEKTYYPLGQGMSNAINDPGSQLGPINDSRLRQVFNFTVYLHNTQGL